MSDAFEQAVEAAERSILQHDTGATIGHIWRALEALAAERRRAAALDELARVDAPLISEPPARLCVRQLEPRSVEPRHWGMF